jgi:hypothetical protein
VVLSWFPSTRAWRITLESNASSSPSLGIRISKIMQPLDSLGSACECVCVAKYSKYSAACRKALLDSDLSHKTTLPTVSRSWQTGKVLQPIRVYSVFHPWPNYPPGHRIAFGRSDNQQWPVSSAEAFLLAIISSPMAFSKNSIQMWRMAGVDLVPHVYGFRASVGRISNPSHE